MAWCRGAHAPDARDGGMGGDLATDNPRTIPFPTVEFNPPDAERLVLDNGMVVYLLEDHELPLVTINATLKTAAGWTRRTKSVWQEMTGAVMRTGGSAGMFPMKSMKSSSSWRPRSRSDFPKSPVRPPSTS